MSLKTAQQLIALSVTALVGELSTNAYAVEALVEARGLEVDDQNRKTAIEAYDDAIAVAAVGDDPEPKAEMKTITRVKKGKSVTSKRGVIDSLDEVYDRDFVGGSTTRKALVSRGICETVSVEA